jgi:XrtN system VIT domain protein
MHWQEGNRITVTVFPCTPSEDRQFKIGLTVPLNIRGGALWVDNIYFKGPDFSNALETTILRFESAESYEPILPPRFEMIRPHTYQRTGDYEPMWTVGVSRSKLSEQAFSFDSHSYTIKRNKYEKIPLNLERVYLDINSHWTDDELKVAFELFDPRMTFVNIDGMYNLENQDMRDLAERQRRFQFSLFPFQDVSSPESALVITKSAPNTPNLSDLKNSAFEKSLKEHLAESNSATRVIDLSEKRSAYLQTLQQFKQVEVTHFDIENVVEILKTGNMPTLTLSENEIEIGNSGYHIARSAATETVPTGGPDHLMRLYNYNKILRDLGPTYFDADTYAEGELLDLANAAFVVSPISSLVVLESQKDYDRFDIKKNKNSLNNASMNSSGAVPEPHEWALIILALLVPLYFRFKKG